MKKQHISPEENTWRQSATNHEFPLMAGDWSAMERLIDQQDDAVAGGFGSSNGSSMALNNRWPFPFFAGVLISLILLAGQAWSAQSEKSNQENTQTTKQTLIADHDSVDEPGEDATITFDDSTVQNAGVSHTETTVHTSTSSSKQSKPITPTPPISAFDVNSESGNTMQIVSPVTLTQQAQTVTQRPPVSDFNSLTEAEYTPGLMAFSRLTGKVNVGIPTGQPDLPTPTTPVLPMPKRWSFGLLAGGRMALPDWPMASSSFGGLAGGFVQFDLTPHWSIRTELAGKLLNRNLQRTDSEVLYDGFGASLKVDQRTHTNGLLFVEMPILAVLHRGRSEFFAGPKLALIRVQNDANSLALTGSAFTEINQYDITDGVRSFDAGLTVGYGYQFLRHWGVDVRYNQGVLDLTHDNFFNNSHTLINSDLQLTIRYVF